MLGELNIPNDELENMTDQLKRMPNSLNMSRIFNKTNNEKPS
jgi:hypothetical protein